MIRRLFLGLVVFVVALAVWAVVIEPGRLVTRDHALQLRGWPAALNGYRIAFVTDIHVGSPHIDLEKLERIVAETNALRPDLILLGGDYVVDDVLGGEKVAIEAIAPALGRLRARDGVYAVIGNHDNWNDGAHIAAVLEAAGVPVLEDRSVRIETPQGGFWLAGVSDFSTAPHDVGKALAGAGDPLIVLTHGPDVFPQLPDRVVLGIAGHTHGGQVYVPFFGRPVVPSIYGQRFVKGVIREGARTYFVGTGIGTSIWPVRFLTPPEISVLVLSPAP